MNKEIIKDQSNFSNAEKEVNHYVISNLESIQKMSVRELAKETFTTTTTIMRYCKKIGYRGFEDFKINIKNDLKDLDYDDFLIKGSENVIHVMNKMKMLYDNVVENTLQLLSVTQLERIVSKLANFKYVDFIVYDANIAFAEYASHYFFLIGKICNIHTSIDEQILFSMNVQAEDHLVIIISRSGSSERLLKVVKELKKRKVYTILFTQSYYTLVSKYCEESIIALYNNNFDKFGDCIFYTSVKYIIDCLIGIYYTNNYDDVLENVEQYNQNFFGTT